MKMFKKIAATVIAAAMSLAMLTACGGGGGGSTTQYKMAKVLAESQKTGKVMPYLLMKSSVALNFT